MILQGAFVENTPEAWSARAASGATSADCAGWSEHGQRARFRAALAELRPQPGESLLDYGCGTGALCETLDPGIFYFGFDPSPGMVARARQDHPTRRFEFHEPTSRFDLIACIGPFNLPDRWSKIETRATLARLWEKFEPRMIAVSLYAGEDERCLRYSVDDALAYGRQMGYHAKAEHILPNDILLTVRR